MSTASAESEKQREEANKNDLNTLHNPVKDKNSGQIWPIVLGIVVISIGWMFTDPELRRGLGQLTGLHVLEPIIEEVINREFLMTVHGTWSSSCTQRVVMAAYEKDLEVEMISVNMSTKQHKSQEHLAMHPFGQIPVLDVGSGSHVYESRAIANYFERRYPQRGASFEINGLAPNVYHDQALSMEAFQFEPLAAAVYKAGSFPNPSARSAAVNASLAALHSKMDGYEVVLSGTHKQSADKKKDEHLEGSYLAGTNVTMADLFHLPLGQKLINAGYGNELFLDEKRRPHVARWWKSISGRKSWQAVLKDIKTYEDEQRKIKEDAEKAKAEKARQEALVHEAEEAFSHHDTDKIDVELKDGKEVKVTVQGDNEKGHKEEKKHHGLFH